MKRKYINPIFALIIIACIVCAVLVINRGNGDSTPKAKRTVMC